MKFKYIIYTLFLSIYFTACSSSSRSSGVLNKSIATYTQDNLKQGEELATKYLESNYKDIGSRNESISAYKRAAEHSNNKSDIFLEIAKLYLYSKNPNFKLSEEFIEKSLKEDPQNDKALAFKTELIFHKKGYRDTVNFSKKVLTDIDSEIIELKLYYIKSLYEYDTNNTKNKLIKLSIRNCEFYNALANFEYAEHNFEKARYLAIKAQEFNKFDVNNFVIRALIELKSGNIYLAKTILESGLKINSVSSRLLNAYAGLLLSLGDLSKSEELLLQAIVLSPANIRVVNNLANLNAMKLKNNLAEDYYQKAFKMDPDYPDTYYNYGNFLLNNKKDKIKSLDYFKQFTAKKIFGLNKDHRVYKIIRELEAE